MKHWIKKTLLGLMGATIAVGGLSACSGGMHHRHGSWDEVRIAQVRGKLIERVQHKLELDAAQTQKLAVLADKLQAQRSALRGTGDQPRQRVQALVAGEKFDRARAQALLDEKLRTVQTASPEVLTALADFYDSLNPEQQNKVRAFMDKRRGWMPRG